MTGNRASWCIQALAVAAAAATWPAFAMMPPGTYEQALARADAHLQLAITAREMVATGVGDCQISGIVVHVFRGPLQMGDELSVAVPCRHDGGNVPVGATVFLPAGALDAAGFLELILEQSADGTHRVAAAGAGAAIIDRPSTEPAIASAAAGLEPAPAALMPRGPDVPCMPGARVEVGTFGYWDKDATIEAGPDRRGRCLVRIGSLTQGVWYTQYQLRQPGSDKPLAEAVWAESDLSSVPEGRYLCHLAGIVHIPELTFRLEGARYAIEGNGGGGGLAFDAAAQEISWAGGPFAEMGATLHQEVASGRYTISFPKDGDGGRSLDYGDDVRCYLQDGL